MTQTQADLMALFEPLKQRAIEMQSLEKVTKNTLIETKAQLEQVASQYKEAKVNKAIQEASMKVFREVIDTMSESHINSIVNLCSYALQTIFHDKDYTLKIEIKDSRNAKQAQLFLVDKTANPQDPILSSINDDSVGGGVITVIGFVLQVFYIMYFKLNRVIFMDEYLSALSSEYVPNMMTFIKELAEKKGFRFVAIMHDTRFYDYADKAYSMVDGELSPVNYL